MKFKCFACDKNLPSGGICSAKTIDNQIVAVGTDCFRKIKAAGSTGYQPPKGGPKLILVDVIRDADLIWPKNKEIK